MNKPWHMTGPRDGTGGSRAFVAPPKTFMMWLDLRMRGWSPFNDKWWSKASPFLRKHGIK